MKSLRLLSLIALFCAFTASIMLAQPAPAYDVVVFVQDGFPTADTATPSAEALRRLLPAARFANADELGEQLASDKTRLLVLPYGSVFPEAQWPAILAYLERGGNLLVIGGRPFTRAAWHDASGWHLREYSVRFAHQLFIDQYETTPGSEGLTYRINPEIAGEYRVSYRDSLPAADSSASQPNTFAVALDGGVQSENYTPFAWKHAFSPVIRLSQKDRYARGGSAGEIDSTLTPLAWGSRDWGKQEGHRVAVPLMAIDHLHRRFAGGRWVFISAELDESFYDEKAKDRLGYANQAPTLINALANYAAAGAIDFNAQMEYPLYVVGETPKITIHGPELREAKLNVCEVSTPVNSVDMALDFNMKDCHEHPYSNGAVLNLDKASGKGLIGVSVELLVGARAIALYDTGYWMRDETFLRSGAKLGVNSDTFTLDDKSMVVAGTTYMASDAQRLYFESPNVIVWDRDLAQIHDAEMNMIRSGWWSGWDTLVDKDGHPNEHTLRTLEAFLMTARSHDLPVQFNFFAFLPDVLGGENPYLDPVAIVRQQNLIGGVAERFRDVPWLAWDLINEPSIAKTMWRMRSNGDAIERKAWREWLDKRYPNKAALAAAWNVTDTTDPAPPTAGEYDAHSMYSGPNSLKGYDFYLFSQENFAHWAQTMRSTIHAKGSQQLIVIGQDEGGGTDRLLPAFFADAVDFTSNHSWWQNDDLLWDSLTAKQPGKPMLIQETGVQRELTMDEIARRSTANSAALLERKLALSMVAGTGAIEWLWNSNGYMTEANETPIGALREDGSEREEAEVMRHFAEFAHAASPWIVEPQQPEVVVLTSQAAQFSANNLLQIEAQKKAVRALAYNNRIAPRIVAENHIVDISGAKLIILPSPQAMTEKEWQAVLNYVHGAGKLLVAGSVDRDEHWQVKHRATWTGIKAAPVPVTYRSATIDAGGKKIRVEFDLDKQSTVEAMRFGDGKSLEVFTMPPYPPVPPSQPQGLLYWAAEPVELGMGEEATAELYAYVLKQAGITPAFELLQPLSEDVLVHATPMKNAVLYVFSNESAEEASISLRDKITGASLSFKLASGRAAMAVIEKGSGKIVARYGF